MENGAPYRSAHWPMDGGRYRGPQRHHACGEFAHGGILRSVIFF
jgi:hypothetical protein